MLPKSLQRLIDSLSRLPGIGQKTAQRLAYHLLRTHRTLGKEIGETLLSLGEKITFCRECFNLSDSQLCGICGNPRRDKNIICVVEHVFDAQAIERCGDFHGVYHILHGRISPLNNITPDNLKIKELFVRIKRLQNSGQIEVILATNPSSEGETTAFYLQRLLRPLGVKLTRIATGIPVGADLEYADEITLGRAIKGRQDYK
ncbi:recombination protein RecR [Candidatus Peregrinibacteria bacterium]|nr:recombination protein RecR [Candidatus Peregrinibacteria bacterium]